jgi:hypothetical protein
MKKIAICTIILLSVLVCKADYDPLPLASLINKSELIAECKIIAVQEMTVELLVIEVIKGNTNETKITISKFRDWTCASRWSAYKVGQVELLFLTKGSTNIWNTLGAGNEGDMPIQKDTLYYKEIYYRLDSVPKTYLLDEGIVTGYKYLLSDVKAGIKQYLKDELLIGKLIKLKTIRKYKTLNSFLERIIAELKEIAYY